MTFTLEKPKGDEREGTGVDELEKMGVEVPEDLRESIEKVIEEEGEDFLREIESGAELYWTFSPFGEAIIESGKVVPGVKAPTQTTGEHSRGVHFTKPGVFPKYALGDINYMRYTQLHRKLDGGGNINSAFGIAIGFPVSYLVSVTPYRQTPRNKSEKTHQAEKDVVFFRSDDGDSAFNYEYDLREAYVFVMSRRSTRDDPRFEDIFEGENLTRLHAQGEDPNYEVAKVVFKSHGFSEEWIRKHVIPLPVDDIYGGLSKEQWEYKGLQGVDDDDKFDMVRLALASKKVHSMIGRDSSVVLPIHIQKDKALEHTDEAFLVQQSRLERLVVLPIVKDSNITGDQEPNLKAA